MNIITSYFNKTKENFFTSHKDLEIIAKNIDSHIQDREELEEVNENLLRGISKDIKILVKEPNITKENIFDIIEKLDSCLSKLNSTQENHNNNVSKIEELIKISIEISNHSFISETVMYEELAQSSIFEIISKEKMLLDELTNIDSDSEEIKAFHEKFTIADNLINDIGVKSNTLLKHTTNLTEKIIDYINKVNDAKSKHKLSPDWNGKKKSLIALNKELNLKRDKYIQKETELNNEISELISSCKLLHLEFREGNIKYYDIIKQFHNNLVSNHVTKMKIDNCINEINKLSNFKTDLEKFIYNNSL